MNREILFRGKSIDSGEWVYGDLIQYAGTAQIWYDTDNGKWNCIVDPATVGQYTGLDDKNGKYIYEGDIVKGHDTILGCDDPSYDYSGVVDFADANFVIRDGFVFHHFLRASELEVLGNRWDNPEFLEEAQK